MIIFIPLFIVNVYWILLPALNIKQPLLRMGILAGLMVLFLVIPTFKFFYAGFALVGTLFLILLDFLNEKKVHPLLSGLIGLFFLFLALQLSIYFLSLIFFGEDFNYYASFPLTIYSFIVLWAMNKKYKFLKNYSRIIGWLCLILPLVILFAIRSYRNNPSTFLRTETVVLNGQTKNYSNTEILHLLKKVEQLIVLDLHRNFENVTSVTFVSVRENAHFRQPIYGNHRFIATVHVNGDSELYYDFNLSYDENDYNSSFLDSASWNTETMHLKSKNVEGEFSITISDLDSKPYKDILESIQIDYYLENDIYTDY